ncbi:prolyl oligopeptidase family serine peptidase [Janibacter cremeus]|uniref:Acetyl esterase/lipase n=1 Tax=Janibacter cremeus TaxID=1285192 RepID=A0A852VIQ7_9MICO|nr:prolyl oligopeptidase family serine peptidase [Janibacter cremeus]NYF96987.1 acetyl esterase/lipase [Janibacter cremeus]
MPLQPTPIEAVEDEALARLLEEGQRDDAGTVERYRTSKDAVFERYGPVEAPAAVLVHGGYFRPGVDRTHLRPQARALVAAGWQVVLPEYRRVPGAACTATEDLAALDAHLRAEHVDVRVWVGHSAGGALALWRALAGDLPPVRVVALAPVADFDAAVAQRLGGDAVRDWIGAGPQESPMTYARLDPTRLAARTTEALADIHLVHGTLDASVPVAQSEDFPAARTLVPDAHHFDLVDPASPHWPTVLGIIRG